MDGKANPVGGVDPRIAQLQHALTSRIVVEQAKGVLAERYTLSLADAFELIRVAARSNGIKVHAIANAVLAEPARTPPQIVALLTRLPAGSTASGRAVENVFREINESFLKLSRDHLTAFMCECANPACDERIEVRPDTMRILHEDRDLYAVRPDHVDLSLEVVVEEFEHFVVVRKPVLS